MWFKPGLTGNGHIEVQIEDKADIAVIGSETIRVAAESFIKECVTLSCIMANLKKPELVDESLHNQSNLTPDR